MNFRFIAIYLLLLLFLTEGCNTLYNTRTIDIEIIEPGKVRIPDKYKNIAVRYNNAGVNYKSDFINLPEEKTNDSVNTDLVVSKHYFQHFIDQLKKQQFFDSVFTLKPGDYLQYTVGVQNIKPIYSLHDSLIKPENLSDEFMVEHFATTLQKYLPSEKKFPVKKNIDPNYGLYSPDELTAIADSTGADLLLSLDLYSTSGGKFYFKKQNLAAEMVYTLAYWNFYDLQKKELTYFYNQPDTISWNGIVYGKAQINQTLPPANYAINVAAEFAAENFNRYLIPHWIRVQRMYYYSGQLDIKKTEPLIQEGKWLEAAEIWKKHINNPNKYIAAKCMYNMGLACEMQGNIDAAIDWVVKSFKVFEQKNEANYINCTNYIQVLSRRKLDIKQIEFQLSNVENND